MKKHLLILCLLPFIFLFAEKQQHYKFSSDKKPLIEIKDSSVYVNGEKFKDLDFDRLTKIIGMPDATHKYEHKETMRRWSYDKNGSKTPCEFSEVNVTDYYYVYNKLGIMLCTGNSFIEKNRNPSRMIVFCGRKREFDHTRQHPFSPESAFSGDFAINGTKINTNENPLPKDVNYNSENFRFHGILCGPTSIGGEIDRIYSLEYSPSFSVYLNNEKEKKISYIEIF